MPQVFRKRDQWTGDWLLYKVEHGEVRCRWEHNTVWSGSGVYMSCGQLMQAVHMGELTPVEGNDNGTAIHP